MLINTKGQPMLLIIITLAIMAVIIGYLLWEADKELEKFYEEMT